MPKLEIITNSEVDEVFERYPKDVRDKMHQLRNLVRATADEISEITRLEETLKWGEPSFITKHGSTLRMDWKSKTPDQYALYFQCTSRLVETFRLVFDDELQYEGKRAVVFDINQQLPVEKLKECIKAALIYHKVKHLITLGI